MNFKFISAACGVLLGLAGLAEAQSQPVVVVELFTSQGCSSCPPADEFASMLAMDPAIMPLSLHVDYWDYIGWADKFASPKFTERQKAYARADGSRSVYTPQFIIGGRDRIEGFQPDQAKAAIRAHLAQGASVGLTVHRKGDQLSISANAEPSLGTIMVQLVRYKPEETVAIERGENAGRSISYTNIVTSWRALGKWSGDQPLAMQAQVSGTDPVVVILQQEGPAEIIAAVQLD